ncbi:MAG: hypothetical protein J6K43_07425 [Lachnospiraceae bacterium]|nr:hypothetical protein [Lachnospiraceae bacterium]
MNLTKFGISAALISVVGYFAGYVGIVPMVLLFIFALYSDADIVVKKNVTQATILSIFFSIVVTVLAACSSGYIDFIGLFSEAYNVYNVLSKLNFFSWLVTICNILEFAVMIYAVIASFKGNVVKLPVISKLVNKHFGEENVQ